MKIIDLSLPLYSGMPVYPGDDPVEIDLVATFDKDAWNMRGMKMNLHNGTNRLSY